MQRKNLGQAMRYLVVVCALVSAFAMVGCGGGGGGDEGSTPVTSGETISKVDTGPVNVNNSTVQALVGEPLAFQNGSIFDASLGNNPATLTFTSANPPPPTFNLNSGGATSSGNTTFGSCTFNFTQGPLAGKSVKFDPCTIQITSGAVIAGGAAVPGTLTLTLGTTSISISVLVRVLADGTLLVDDKSTGITITSSGSPVNTGTTGSGGQ